MLDGEEMSMLVGVLLEKRQRLVLDGQVLAMHHGHEFEAVSRNGVSPAFRQMQDTINVSLYETVVLPLNTNNPGDWMAHCHIQAHQYGGTMTVLRVLEE